jgi:valyl-tRNA synthetase
VTEEVWSWCFAAEQGRPSIHRAPWPSAAELDGVAPPADAESFDLAVACWTALNKAKADAEVSMGREIEAMTLVASPATLERVKAVLGDVLAAARCRAHDLEPAELEDGSFEVRAARFSERAP